MLLDQERVLYPRRLKALGLFAVCVPFVAIGVWMIVSGEWTGWLGVGFFGLGALVSLVMLVPNGFFLRLDAEGFHTRTLFKSQSYRWSDVDGFGVEFIGLNKMVVFNLSSGFDRHVLGRKVAAALSGWEAALPDSYCMSPEVLAGLLNEYKKAVWLKGANQAQASAGMQVTPEGDLTALRNFD